jgi:hypothetical protein
MARGASSAHVAPASSAQATPKETFWEAVQNQFTAREYTTGRLVAIHDYRLALFNMVGKLLVLVYVVVIQIVLNHGYANFETPAVTLNLWQGVMPNFAANNLPFCNNVAYDWGLNFTEQQKVITGAIEFGPNTTCRPFDSRQHVMISDSSFSAFTHEQLFPMNGSDHLPDAVVSGNVTYVKRPDGSFSFFTTNPGDANFNLIHVISAQFLSEGLPNVRLLIKNKAGDTLREFDDGAVMGGVTLNDWLSFAEVKLDDINVQPWTDVSPFYRTTGLVLLLRMTYSNLRTWELPSLGIGSPLVECEVERVPLAWGYLGDDMTFDNVLGPVTRRRFGVKVLLVPTGTVGQFSWFALVLRFVEGVVLFGIAEFFTNMLARLWLHRDVYHNTIVSHVTQEKIQESRKRIRSVKRLSLQDQSPSMVTEATSLKMET